MSSGARSKLHDQRELGLHRVGRNGHPAVTDASGSVPYVSITGARRRDYFAAAGVIMAGETGSMYGETRLALPSLSTAWTPMAISSIETSGMV